MTQSSAGAGAGASAGIDPGATVQGGTGSLTITLPGCVEIKPGQPGTPDSSGGMGSGVIIAFAGADAPEDWLLCNGAAVDRTEYASLFSVIDTTFGVGNGNTTFNLPDLRGRFPLGLDNMGNLSADRVTAAEADTRGESGGAETHTLTIDEMPTHSHGVDHINAPSSGGGLRALEAGGTNRHDDILTSNANEDFRGPVSGDTVGGLFIKNRGGGSSHNNMPPYLSLNYIIKT